MGPLVCRQIRPSLESSEPLRSLCGVRFRGKIALAPLMMAVAALSGAPRAAGAHVSFQIQRGTEGAAVF